MPGIDAEIPLLIRSPQPINPLADITQVLQLKQMQALGPLRLQEAQLNAQSAAMDLQEKQRQIQQRKALNDAFSQAVTTDPNTGAATFDTQKLNDALVKAGHADQIPVVQENLTKYQKGMADLADAQSKVDALHMENGAAIGAASKAAGYDPAFFAAKVQAGIQNRAIDPANATPVLQALQQAMQQDPTGDTAKQIVQKYSDAWLNASEKMVQAQARAKASQTGETRLNAELPEITARTQKTQGEVADRAYQQAVGALATNPPKDAAAYQETIDALPHGVASRILQAVPVEQYDPQKSPGLLNQSAMTPEQRFKANNPGSETGTQNKIEFQNILAKIAPKLPPQAMTDSRLLAGSIRASSALTEDEKTRPFPIWRRTPLLPPQEHRT